MGDQDLNERTGEAPPQSKLENPGGNKNKTKTQSKHPQGRTADGTFNPQDCAMDNFDNFGIWPKLSKLLKSQNCQNCPLCNLED